MSRRPIQPAGTAYIDRHGTWDDRHESIAATVREVEGQRFLRFRNRSLDD